MVWPYFNPYPEHLLRRGFWNFWPFSGIPTSLTAAFAVIETYLKPSCWSICRSALVCSYAPGIVRLCDQLVEELIHLKGPVPLVDRMRSFAFAVIAAEVLGLDLSEQQELFEDFEVWARGLFSFPLAWPGSPLAKAKAARQRLLRLGCGGERGDAPGPASLHAVRERPEGMSGQTSG